MQLIGMLDSPFVRRIAITLQWHNLPFEHRALSVFVDFDQFSAINPMVKAPSLICDDGTVMMESTSILSFIELQFNPQKSIHLQSELRRQWLFQILGLAQATAEKLVQLYYEREVRPAQAQFPAWEKRVEKQIRAGFSGLEAALKPHCQIGEDMLDQGTIAAVTAASFHEDKVMQVVDFGEYPHLRNLREQFEATALFQRYPPVGPPKLSL